MTASEVYTAIKKSTEERGYEIVYNINNNHFRQAISQIQSYCECSEETAAEMAQMIKDELENIKKGWK